MQPAATIELLDERGNREDALTLVGPGASASVREDADHRISMHAERSAADIALVSLRGDGVVLIELKRAGAFRDRADTVAGENLEVAPAGALELWLEQVDKHILVRSQTTDVPELSAGRILAAVVRSGPSAAELDEASVVLRARAVETARSGIAQVRTELEELRRAGLVDAQGRRLVDLPPDMSPGSRSDV